MKNQNLQDKLAQATPAPAFEEIEALDVDGALSEVDGGGCIIYEKTPQKESCGIMWSVEAGAENNI